MDLISVRSGSADGLGPCYTDAFNASPHFVVAMNLSAQLTWFGILFAGCLAGCGGPAELEQPRFNATAISDRLMEAYDDNGDGLLSQQELQECPSILGAMSRFDSSGDGQVSPEEVAERVQVWSTGRVALMRFQCRLELDGAPLGGARVELVPEPALAAVIKPASGVSRNSGSVDLQIAPADLPPDTPYKGVHMGLYKVQVTHPDVDISARYNTDTELGQEVARDLGYENIVFNLKNESTGEAE